MPSTAIDSQIHGCMFSTDEMRKTLSDEAWVQKWLDTEAALAKAQGELGIIPKDKADIIQKYAKAELLDIPSIGEFYKSSITIVPLLKAFKKVLPDNAGEFVHWGATSQDIVDTGRTLDYLLKYLNKKEPNSIKTVSMLSKPSRRVININADYVGFEIEDKFVIGYGLDYNEKYRNLPYVGYIE